MNNTELIAQARLALSQKTLYVKGGIGNPLYYSNKKSLKSMYAFNRAPERAEKIDKANSNTFAFDCVCFIKALLWGWDADTHARFGGAKYCGSETPDVGYRELFDKYCKDQSTVFDDIMPGELLIMPDHVGLYIGNGQTIEVTLSPCGDGVVLCDLNQRADGRRWQAHGKIKEIDYPMKESKIQIIIPKSMRHVIDIKEVDG